MALPFVASDSGDASYCAELTTGERLFLVRAVADVLELLGDEDETPVPGGAVAGMVFEGDSSLDFEAVDLSVEQDPRAYWERGESEEIAVEQLEAVLNALNEHDESLAPTDPAVRRLLPDASLDPDVAAEFRKYTDFDLREQKVQRLMILSERLTDVEPSADDDEHLAFVVEASEAEAIAGALGDIRLVLGERLDLRTDDDATALYEEVLATAQLMAVDEEPDLSRTQEKRYIMGMLFELAGFLQESLTLCMLEQLRARRRSE